MRRALSLPLLPCVAALSVAAGTARAESWSGLYVGLHLGLGGGGADVEEINGPRGYLIDTRGVIAGAQMGWNSRHGRWLWGVEFEAGDLGQSGDITRGEGGATVRSESTLRAHAGLSARAGWLATPSVLVFARLGADVARFSASTAQACEGAGCAIAPSRASASGATPGLVLGFGAESAIGEGWRLRLDYTHYRYREELVLPPAAQGGPGWRDRLDLHALRLGVNYGF
jgi:opacity protein-like surface antigen